MQHLDDVAAGECRPAREHLEEDRAGREQIGARVDRLARDLLGRHVARRAHHLPGARELGGRARATSRRARAGRQAEVEQLHAVRREEDVRRLEVAVDDAARVQRGERGQHAERRSARVSATLSGPRAAARRATRPRAAPSR